MTLTIDEFTAIYEASGEVAARLVVNELGNDVYRVFQRHPELIYWLPSLSLHPAEVISITYDTRQSNGTLRYADTTQADYSILFYLIHNGGDCIPHIAFDRVPVQVWVDLHELQLSQWRNVPQKITIPRYHVDVPRTGLCPEAIALLDFYADLPRIP